MAQITEILNKAIAIVGTNAMRQLKLDDTLAKAGKIAELGDRIDVTQDTSTTRSLQEYIADEERIYKDFEQTLENVLNFTEGETEIRKSEE